MSAQRRYRAGRGRWLRPGRRCRRARGEILDRVSPYFDAAFAKKPFIPGVTPVPVSGKVFDADDVRHLVDASLDFWLTTGRFAARFESDLAKFVGCRSAALVNSGSSANLLALSALTSPKLAERRLMPGDEVITVASGFPTTVNPILQNGLIPVFIDVDLGTYDADVTQLDKARSGRTRAVMLAHTLGNPFDLAAVTDFCKRHDLWLVEDCCDALGRDFQRPQVRHVRPRRLRQLLSRPPHHHRRGRRRLHQ